MLNAPDSPSSFCWPPKTNSPDVVSWRNTDHLKYDFAPLKNPNRWISPTLQREFDEARTAEFIGLAKKLTRSIIKKPAPVYDITHIRAFNDSFKKQTERDIGKIFNFYCFSLAINILYSTFITKVNTLS